MATWNFDSAALSSGAQGIKFMHTAKQKGVELDLVILDFQMPEMSGADVLATMRADKSLQSIPVVMLTSVDSSQANQKLAQLGAEANLTKPARSSLLLETILQVISDNHERLSVGTREEAPIKKTGVDCVSNGLLKAQTTEQILDKSSGFKQYDDERLDVLVAEDNEVNQIVVRQILEQTGLNFKIVENSKLALATYKLMLPRMILMDVSMPEMNGKEATVAIREHEAELGLPRTPIIGVTAHALKGDKDTCLDAGMDDYLSKPVSPNELHNKVDEWMGISEKLTSVA